MSLRVAIAGAGLMGKWHAHYARQCGASVCGVADPHRAAGTLPRSFRGAAVFEQVQPLLRRLQPDVLHICSPAGTHEEIIEAALAAGVHLLVEKPLAPNTEITARLLARASEKNLLLVPVHQFAFQDGVMRTAASFSRLGTPLHFDAVICSAGGSEMRNERLDELVADVLPHPLSLLDRFFPNILDEIQWTRIRTGYGEWRVLGQARQISISILVSLHARPTEASLRIAGTNGTVRLDLFHGFAVSETGAVSRGRKIIRPFSCSASTFLMAGRNLVSRLVQNAPAYPGLRRLIASFYEAVQGRSPEPLSPEQILQLARTRDLLTSPDGRLEAF